MSDWAEEMRTSRSKVKERHDRLEAVTREERKEVKALKREIRRLDKLGMAPEKVEELKTKVAQVKKRAMLERNRIAAAGKKERKVEWKSEGRQLIAEGRFWREMRKRFPELRELFDENFEDYLKKKSLEGPES